MKELSHSLFCICRLHQSHSSFVSRGYHLPEQVSGSFHDYKYRLYYGDNKRELRFDNERNKGEHCHIDDIELPYRFISPAQLMEDFLVGVTILREE